MLRSHLCSWFHTSRPQYPRGTQVHMCIAIELCGSGGPIQSYIPVCHRKGKLGLVHPYNQLRM